jgi:hypothetical protein
MSDINSRQGPRWLDQAMRITKCVGATIPEDEGFDRRAALMGVATLIEGIYMDIAEPRELL